DKNLPVYGRGENVRDWIYVTDHCRAVSSVIQSGNIGHVYNIGASCERRNIDLVKKLIETAGKSEELITFVKDRPGHDYRYAIDSSKIRNETGWRPDVSFEQGLKETFDWYKENLKG
ncbi:MAG: GDP-mannose 4,6-dehydratase, partial [Chitinivibrionales bacterium]